MDEYKTGKQATLIDLCERILKTITETKLLLDALDGASVEEKTQDTPPGEGAIWTVERAMHIAVYELEAVEKRILHLSARIGDSKKVDH